MKQTAIWMLGFLGTAVLSFGQGTSGPDLLRYPPLASVSASPKTFGTSQDSLLRVGAADFDPLTSAQDFSYTDGSTTFLRYSLTPGNQGFIAHPTLPSGALLVGVEFDACDIDPGDDLFVQVLSTDNLGSNLQVVGNPVQTTGTPGCDPMFVDLAAENFVVDNTSNQLLLDIVLLSGTTTHSFAGATVFYRLQVSPAPAVASFNDVPTTHPFFQFIEALKSSGITGGCQAVPPLYCPDSFVTRGQMAVFLAKALGLQFP